MGCGGEMGKGGNVCVHIKGAGSHWQTWLEQSVHATATRTLLPTTIPNLRPFTCWKRCFDII